MNAVVDTNVVAYYILGTQEFFEEAQQFWHAVDVAYAPASWQAEFVNVVWMATRQGVLTAALARQRLELADGLAIRAIEVTSLWQGALELELAAALSLTARFSWVQMGQQVK